MIQSIVGSVHITVNCIECLSQNALDILIKLQSENKALQAQLQAGEQVINTMKAKLKAAGKGSEDAKLDEWCNQCNEYDQQKHCCPRFNHVIRNTVDELKKQEQWNYVKDGLPTTDDWMEVAILDEHGDTPFTYTSFGWYWEMAKGWIVDNDYRADIYAWKPLSRAPEVVKGE